MSQITPSTALKLLEALIGKLETQRVWWERQGADANANILSEAIDTLRLQDKRIKSQKALLKRRTIALAEQEMETDR